MKTKMKYVVALAGVLLTMTPAQVYAGDENSLTYLFQTKAFSGSMETISKLNWVGALLSGIISVFCLAGLFLTVVRIMASLLYLSGQGICDKIHEIKSANQGAFFGLKSLVTNTFQGNGNTGSGVDTAIYFILGLFPDIKMYSDFADGSEAKGLGPDTTITEYLLKISIPTIMTIFFLAIGFSGTLWQMFGTVVDAMSVAAERVATTNLESQVSRLLNADSYYTFGFGDDGSKWGKLQDGIAKSMYNKVLSKSDSSINGDTSLKLGSTIGTKFAKGGQFSKEAIAKMCGNVEYAKSDAEAKNVKYSVVINSIPTSSDTNHETVINVNDLCAGEMSFSGNQALYIHVYIYRKESAIQTNYFSAKDKGAKDKPTTNGKGDIDNSLKDSK